MQNISVAKLAEDLSLSLPCLSAVIYLLIKLKDLILDFFSAIGETWAHRHFYTFSINDESLTTMYAAPELLQSPNEMKTRNMYQISKLSNNWLSRYANLEG